MFRVTTARILRKWYNISQNKCLVLQTIDKTQLLFVKIDPRYMNIQRPFIQSSGIIVKSEP